MTMPKSLEQRAAAWNRRALTAAQQQGQAAPPIAPVGVEAIREAFDEISGLCRHLRQGGPAPEDLQDLSDALHEAVGIAANMLHALAQQPAAGVGEEIMVNAAHDVYTLPLQPSGLLSGPRFVVHVPGPEQTAAVDDPDAAARAYAARMGDRWEHMGEEARQRARELAAQRLEPPL